MQQIHAIEKNAQLHYELKMKIRELEFTTKVQLERTLRDTTKPLAQRWALFESMPAEFKNNLSEKQTYVPTSQTLVHLFSEIACAESPKKALSGLELAKMCNNDAALEEILQENLGTLFI